MAEVAEKNIRKGVKLMSKVILVTGGSKGIGADIAQYLAQKGYNVILNYNKSEEEAKKNSIYFSRTKY